MASFFTVDSTHFQKAQQNKPQMKRFASK